MSAGKEIWRVFKWGAVACLGIGLIGSIFSGPDSPPETESERVARLAMEAVERSDRLAREAEEQAQRDAECRQDLQCWSLRHNADAYLLCGRLIENSAIYDYRWTDGLLGTRFDYANWANRSSGVIRYSGDNIEMQNGLGNWIRHSYWCHYDPASESVEDFGVEQGRL